MTIDITTADKLLTTTRGVRRRMDFDKPVDLSVVEEAIAIALQAPVGTPDLAANFVVVSDSELRRVVGDLYLKSSEPYYEEQEAMALEEADPSSVESIRREFATYRWHAETLHRVPVLIVVAMKGRFEDQGVLTQASMYGSVLPAAWSLMLALRARGLGSCWTTLHLAYETEAARALGIPEDVTQALLLPVGHYTGTDFRPATRPPATDYIHWNQWGQRDRERHI